MVILLNSDPPVNQYSNYSENEADPPGDSRKMRNHDRARNEYERQCERYQLEMSVVHADFPLSSTNASRSTKSSLGDPRFSGKIYVPGWSYGSCHRIPGISQAESLVGLSLERIGSRVYIAGQFVNEPATMIGWIRDPRHVRSLHRDADSGGD